MVSTYIRDWNIVGSEPVVTEKNWNQNSIAAGVMHKLKWMSQEVARSLVKLFFEIIVEGVVEDGEVVLLGFGRFKAHLNYSPVLKNNWHYIIKFHAYPELNAVINGTDVETMQRRDFEKVAQDLEVHKRNFPCIPNDQVIYIPSPSQGGRGHQAIRQVDTPHSNPHT